jgi:hypothetical protein
VLVFVSNITRKQVSLLSRTYWKPHHLTLRAAPTPSTIPP